MTQTTNVSSISYQCSTLSASPTTFDGYWDCEGSAKLLKDYRQLAHRERGGHLLLRLRLLLESGSRVRGDRRQRLGVNLEYYLATLVSLDCKNRYHCLILIHLKGEL